MWFHDFLQFDFSRFASFPFPVIPSCISKICQIVASISMTSQFHKFSYLIFEGFDFSRSISFPFPVIPSCIFKICQIVASINMTSQFHKFLYVIFGGFLLFETFSRRCRSCWWRLWCGWRSPAPWGSWSRRSPSPGVYLNFAHRARLWDVHVPVN